MEIKKITKYNYRILLESLTRACEKEVGSTWKSIIKVTGAK